MLPSLRVQLFLFAVITLLSPFACAAAKGAVTASFDCRVAKTPTEHLICSDENLAALDKKVSDLFHEIHERSGASWSTQLGQQREWLTSLRLICPIPSSWPTPVAELNAATSCMTWNYEDRIGTMQGTINQILNPPMLTPPAPKASTEHFGLSCPDNPSAGICKRILGNGNIRYNDLPASWGGYPSFSVPTGYKKIEWEYVNSYEDDSELQTGCCIPYSKSIVSEGVVRFSPYNNNNMETEILRIHEIDGATDVRDGTNQVPSPCDFYIIPFPGRKNDVIKILSDQKATCSQFVDGQTGGIPGNIVEPSSVSPDAGQETTSEMFTDGNETYLVALSDKPTAALFQVFSRGDLILIGTYQSPDPTIVWDGAGPSASCPAKGGAEVSIVDELPLIWIRVTPDDDLPEGTFATLAGAHKDTKYVYMREESNDNPSETDETTYFKMSVKALRAAIVTGEEDFTEVDPVSGQENDSMEKSDFSQRLLRTKAGVFLEGRPPIDRDTWPGPPPEYMYHLLGPNFLNTGLSWETASWENLQAPGCSFAANLRPPATP